MIDFVGAFFGVAGGTQEEPERARVGRERELLGERRIGPEDRRRAVRGGAHASRGRSAQAGRESCPRSSPCRSRCRRGRRSRRSRRARGRRRPEIATARCFPESCVGIASVRPALRSAVVICWPGKMSRDGDAPVEVRRIGDRADLEVVLRERRGLEELLLGDDRARGALRDQVLRDEHRCRRRRVVDARAVLDEVRDQQDRGQHRRGDAEGERPAARLLDLGGERGVRHGGVPPGFLSYRQIIGRA